MADHIIPPPPSEVIIAIIPRMYTEWRGTSAQLREIGLIPNDLEWPQGNASGNWRADAFNYWLRRYRPAGMKGPMRLWHEGDFWFLRRYLTADHGAGAVQIIYEKKRALEDAIWRQSPDGCRAANRHWEARIDAKFQSFLLKAGAVQPEKRRERKARDTGQATPPATGPQVQAQ